MKPVKPRFTHPIARRPTAFAKTRDLVGLAQGGNNVALNDLLHRYLPRILRVVRLKRGEFLGRRFEDHDLVQETLIRVWKSIDQYNPRETASFLLWVTRVAENALRDLARRQLARKRNPGNIVSLEEDEVRRNGQRSSMPVSSSTPSRIVSTFEASRAVDQAVAEMDEESKRLLILRFYYDLPLKDLSKTLHLDSEAVRSRIRRALLKLRPRLEDHGVVDANHPITAIKRSFLESDRPEWLSQIKQINLSSSTAPPVSEEC